MTQQKQEGGRPDSVSYDDIKNILVEICRERREEDAIGPITVSEMQAELKIRKDIEVSDQTIRNKGYRKKGYFEKKYESLFFNNTGDTRLRGMMIQREEFLEEVES